MFTYPRTTYLTWPFPSIVLAPFRYEHESRKSPFSSYLVQNPLTLIFHGNALSHLCHFAHDVPCSTLGRTVKWTWMSPKPNLNGPPRVFTYPRTKYLTWPFPSIVWLRSGTNMKVENLRSVSYLVQKSVDPDLPRQCPFPSVSLAHDVPCSTLGRTVNELEWALHNPLVWVIDSIMHSTKIGSLGCCAQDMIREYLGC